jgi:hypothetical protein
MLVGLGMRDRNTLADTVLGIFSRHGNYAGLFVA